MLIVTSQSNLQGSDETKLDSVTLSFPRAALFTSDITGRPKNIPFVSY